MSSHTPSTVINDLFQSACKIGETNLKLQREMLLGWSRMWPTFSDWQAGSPTPFAHMRSQWTDTIQDLAQKQRDLLDRQFEAAFSSLDLVFGVENKPNGSVAEEEKPKATEQPSSVPPTSDPVAEAPSPEEVTESTAGSTRNIAQKVALVTGAASGIGEAVARELANRGARAVMMVDRSDDVLEVANSINETVGRDVAIGKVGDTTDAAFRKRVFDDAKEGHGIVTICVPAAGITRDALSVRINKETGKAELYPVETFRQVTEVNLIAPIYWAVEMVARIAEDRAERGLKRWEPEERVQGAVVFLGSVSSQGNKGQIAYAVAKAGLEGAAATLMKEAIFHGVRCGIIHPGFTDTPMARSLGEDFLGKYVLPYTQLRRLIRPEEIADAICFMISNAAVSGELWADAGWHPPA